MIVWRIPLYPSPSFPIVIILYCRDTFVTTKKPTLVHSYQLSSLLYWDSLVFPPNALFLFQDTTLHCYHVFFASFGLWQFLRLPLSLITITALSSTGQRLCRISSDLGLSIWAMERRVSFSSHHIQSMCLSHGITDDTHLDHLAEVGFVRILHCKVTFPLCRSLCKFPNKQNTY